MNKEEIYDAEIAPLMTQIIDVCKTHKIAALATFHIPTDEDENLACTTSILTDDFKPPAHLIQAANCWSGRKGGRCACIQRSKT
jgi:hypothetical protein